MRTKLLLLALALAIAGCSEKASPPPAPKAPPQPVVSTPAQQVAPAGCSGDNCMVTINIDDGCKFGAVSPNPLPVAKNGQHTIRFKLAGPAKYKFAANGIEFPYPQPTTAKPPRPPADPKVPFPPAGHSGGNSPVFIVLDKNDTPEAVGIWKYNVNVTDGEKSCSLDPDIDNN